MIDLLRKLLDLRESLESVSTGVAEYGFTEHLPELAQMQAMERKIFEKVNEWSKPDATG